MSHQEPPKICDYEGSDYQASFWEQGGREYEDAAEHIALKRLLPKSGQLMLEVGAGAGRNTPRYGSFERIVLLDYSVTQLQQARDRLGIDERFVYVAADAYRLPFVDGCFDGATMIRVLHHMADGPRVLAEIRRVMQPGSSFILEYASKLHLKSILRYALRMQSWSPFTPEPVEFVELNFDFHPKTIRRWLSAAGFTIRRQVTVSHFRVRLVKRAVPWRWLAWLDGLAGLTGDLWQLTPSVFVGCTAAGDPPQAAAGRLFACPDCRSKEFDHTETSLHCKSCGRDWRVENGIYIFK